MSEPSPDAPRSDEPGPPDVSAAAAVDSLTELTARVRQLEHDEGRLRERLGTLDGR